MRLTETIVARINLGYVAVKYTKSAIRIFT